MLCKYITNRTSFYGTYQWDIQGPEFSSKFTIYLQRNLLSNTSQFILLGYCSSIDHLKYKIKTKHELTREIK